MTGTVKMNLKVYLLFKNLSFQMIHTMETKARDVLLGLKFNAAL